MGRLWQLYSYCPGVRIASRSVCGCVAERIRIRLELDLDDPDDIAFVWWLLREFRPKHVHVGPPCTFWGPLGRMTAVRLPSEWEDMRRQALHHLQLAVRIMRWQSRNKRTGPFEQPPRCISWRLECVESVLAIPGWQQYMWPSCCYDHRDPGSGRLCLKWQAFASNLDLSSMYVPCTCPRKSHQVVDGSVQGGPRHGECRSVVSGEYPVAMCKKVVDIIRRAWL